MHSQIIDQLIHAEQRSLIARLPECTVFVSWASADESRAVDVMLSQQQEHVAWLVELLSGMGESPTPLMADTRHASLHFVDLNYLMPAVVNDTAALIAKYEHQLPRLASDAAAHELVGRILSRHRQQLETLQSMNQGLTTTEQA